MMRRTVIALALFSTSAFAQQKPDFKAAQAEAAQHLASLVKQDTSNPPGNEIKAAQYLKSVFDKEGIPSEIFESAPGRGNIVARLKGNGSKRPLLLMGHIDVVGVERDKWTVDPFAATIKDGYLYGRGASDDKGNVAANLTTFLLLHRLKVPLDRDVIFLAEAGEEGTTKYGIDFMVAQHWDKIDSEFALNEGGGGTVENGKLKYIAVGTTEKVPRGLKLVAKGTSGHGSIPRLDNAITHLGAAVGKVGNWQAPARLNETTRAFFSRMAQISPPEEAALYRNIEDPAVQEKLRSLKPAYNSMLRTSIVPTILKGGFRSNVIPADAEATLDVRALPDEDIEKLKSQMQQLINDPQITIEGPTSQDRPASPPSKLDTVMFHALEHAQQQVFPEAITVPQMGTGATDSAQLRAKGVQSYGIGVPKTDDDSRRVHGNDERLSLDWLGRFVEYLFAAVTEVAASK